MPRNISNVDTGGGGGGGDASLPSDPTFNSVQASTTIAAQGNISTGASMIAGGLTVNGVSNHNSIANFSAPIVASGQTISANEVAATTCKASTIQSLDGADETLVVRANFITRPVGSTLQIVPDQLNASSMVSSDLNISAGSDISAVGNIVSSGGKLEATNGGIIGVTSSISTRLTCESIHVSNGLYDDQEIKCGRLTLSSGEHDGWAILQGANGSGLQDTLGIVSPNANGVLTVYDENNNPLLIQSKLGLIIQTQLNLNANLLLGSTNNLRFGGYNFTPQQYYRQAVIVFDAITPHVFLKCGSNSNQLDWVNQNTGATGLKLNDVGFYKLTIRSLQSVSGMTDFRCMSDIVIFNPNDNTPGVTLPVSFGYTDYVGSGPPIITGSTGFLSASFAIKIPGFSNVSNLCRITVTKMNY